MNMHEIKCAYTAYKMNEDIAIDSFGTSIFFVFCPMNLDGSLI